ncbi:MAG TPA: 3-deoxy-8-phosphooctulonate synthase [Patescibacteria group bacterium]|nr:3-deoxy-8-phosphooctulonate synthase [Patescibacteria group bacterium]
MRVKLGNFEIGNDLPFFFIGGPDSLENLEHAMKMATSIKAVCDGLGIPYVFKASFDKANRTSAKSFRGVGLEKGIEILGTIRKELGVPVTTDFHTAEQAALVGPAVDILQVPALLSRQTDIIQAAAKHAGIVNIKKGQFIAPHDMGKVIEKAVVAGNPNVLATERGYMFGYNDVVADMRSLHVMKKTGHPVIFDAAHTAQTPSASGETSGGDRTLMPPLARAAVAVGVAGVFMEVHDDPDNAPVDGQSSLDLKDLKDTLATLQKIDRAVKGY